MISLKCIVRNNYKYLSKCRITMVSNELHQDDIWWNLGCSLNTNPNGLYFNRKKKCKLNANSLSYRYLQALLIICIGKTAELMLH